MRQRVKFIVMSIATLFVLLSSSCSNSTLYHKFETVNSDGWLRDSVLIYSCQIDSVASLYDIDIELNYNNNYQYSNLYLFVEASDTLEQQLFSDTLNITLADEYGRWLGDGWGSTYQQRVEYKKDLSFNKKGVYNIKVTQGMRDNPIGGIERVGVKIKMAKQAIERGNF